MKLYSTNNKKKLVSLKEAVLKGLPEDNGLYMPIDIPTLPSEFIKNLPSFSFQEIAFTIAKTLFTGAIPDDDLHTIINNSITFPAPLVQLDAQTHILELFHGPSLAFKDFGARFMAQLMSYFNQEQTKELIILVATSGDTGGAVAAGFHHTPGIQVVILYPSEKVSFLQEKQLTTLGGNITALEVDGSFDDCQDLVKKAFLAPELTRKLRLSSANSINIARLIPQSFYYFEAFKQLKLNHNKVVFSIPSGNFGNLTAGLIAQKMGLPIDHYIAATNVNDVVPAYLKSATYSPKPSIRTLSNAMDVGNPSNFARMIDLFGGKKSLEGSTWNNMQSAISGYAYGDIETKKAMQQVYQQHQYTLDPHGAVGYLALKAYQKENKNTIGVILETAHPAKFKADVDKILGHATPVPDRLSILEQKNKVAVKTANDFTLFKSWLLHHF